jgi:energy-coupling factor transporter ATP-binding protein EcfA2
MSHYSFEEVLIAFEKKGKEIFGNHFRVYEYDKDVLLRLFVYFSKDEEMAQKLGISFRKGILLNGKVGCGKTSIMTVFRVFLPYEFRYVIKSCREISFQFSEEGYSIINNYSKVIIEKPLITNICFDDLGSERSLKHFGSECNVMREIMLSRYDKFITNKIITHLTTNLTSSEIEEYYGKRVRSRMREMFNLISFDENTIDKRA